MLVASTRNRAEAVTFREALVRGLAPDGGLYLPVALPRIEAGDLESWRGVPFGDLAAALSRRLLGDEFPATVIERLVRDALDFPVPTVPIEPGRFVLELFHGPTLAFKDFGARFLARLLGHVLASDRRRATILVATSGDTGSAVAHGFHDVPHVHVVVLYPRGKVSPFQEAQMATLGGNVTAIRVPGTFDDCQRLVREAFLDPRLSALHLSSANSINIGRLLPQTFYYAASYLAVTRGTGSPIVFSVPTGNVGNLTAGVLAQRLGIPIARFVVGTNLNAVLPEYLESGGYRPRPSVATISNAMDVGDPSNFERLAQLHAGSLDALRHNLFAVSIDEAETRATIRDVHARTGYVLDPHGAVGWAAAARFAARCPGAAPIVTLATAHPAKFGNVIARELGFTPPLPDSYLGWESRCISAVDLPDARVDSLVPVLLS
jgi:threonine synthase